MAYGEVHKNIFTSPRPSGHPSPPQHAACALSVALCAMGIGLGCPLFLAQFQIRFSCDGTYLSLVLVQNHKSSLIGSVHFWNPSRSDILQKEHECYSHKSVNFQNGVEQINGS